MPMNMTDIARLAGVRRPVVSMWRARHTSGPLPFPAPLPQAGAHGGVLFDEREVTGLDDESVGRPDLLESARHG